MDKINIKNLIIGFGKAGKTLAADLTKHGEEVILVEKSSSMYGGTCINIGCIPSKKLLVEAEKRPADANQSVYFEQAMERKNALISALRAANYKKLDDLEGVRIINATASFINKNTVLLKGEDKEIEVTAERIFINTGTTPISLNIKGGDGNHVYNSTQLLSLNTLPKRLVIIGGGYISLEFACMFQAFGSKVTILEASDTFLAREDRDVADEMLRILNSRGIEVKLNAKTTELQENDSYTTVITSQGNFDAEAVLVAIGRKPATDELELHNADIKTDERGYIITNDYLQVCDHIWAMGDVAKTPQFTYMSLDDYRIVRDQLFGESKRNRLDRKNIATSVFTYPTLAQVGLTEQQAKAAELQFEVKKIAANSIPKAKILGQTDGLLKAIIEKESNRILGVTLFCAEAHELINICKLAIDNNITADQLKNQIYTHPTMTEALNDLFA
ncbi:FAD-dependent oxidoreductase [Hoylesella nanceiensis]